MQGVPLKEVTAVVAAERLISSPNDHAAYALVHHHWKQMMKAARGKEIIIEAEQELYVARLEQILQKAFSRSDGYDDDGNRTLTPMEQFHNLKLAVEIAEKIAAADGVATRPKIEADLNVGEKFDPVKEHARAVVEKQRLRASGKIIDINSSVPAEKCSR